MKKDERKIATKLTKDWIKCEDKLPTEDGEYFVTVTTKEYHQLQKRHYIHVNYHDKQWIIKEKDILSASKYKVDAWMPIPDFKEHANPNSPWILCSDSLPHVVTGGYGQSGDYFFAVFQKGTTYSYGRAYFYPKRCANKNVIAWMPTKTYEGEKLTKEDFIAQLFFY